MTGTIDADGDATAVFERERPRLTRLAHAITGSNALADDIVQDAYLRFRGRADVDNPPAFLRTVVVNLSRDALRKRSVAERVRHEPPVPLSIEPLVADGERILYWPMEPGERPWGVQVVDDEGFAAASWSFTDLPAD